MSTAYSALAEYAWWIEVRTRRRRHTRIIQFVERRGHMTDTMHAKAEFLRVQFDLGDWDEIDRCTRDLLRWSQDTAVTPS